jgi:hypothetical protein
LMPSAALSSARWHQHHRPDRFHPRLPPPAHSAQAVPSKYNYGTLNPTSAGSETIHPNPSYCETVTLCETGGGFARVEYQRTGSGRPVSQAVFDITRVPDPEGWLTARLGELADYQLCEVIPSKQKRPPPPAPKPEPAREPEPVEPPAAPAPEPILPPVPPVRPPVFGTLVLNQADSYMQPPADDERPFLQWPEWMHLARTAFVEKGARDV